MPFETRMPYSFGRILKAIPAPTLVLVSSILLPVILSTVSFFSSGCASYSASIDTRLDPVFARTSIQRLVVLPIRSSRLPLTDAQQLDRDFLQTVRKRRPSIVIISSADAVRALHEKGLAHEWTRFLHDWNAGGIPDAGLLRTIGQTLGVDAIIQGEISNIEKTDGVYRTSKATTRATVRYAMLGVQSGTLLWEASSIGLLTTVTTLESAPPIMDVVQMAHQKVLETLPW